MDSNDPAFPHPTNSDPDGNLLYPHEENGGLSIREHFAGLAMQGILANPSYADWTDEVGARIAVRHADALILALSKPTRLEAAVDQATDKLNEMVKP